MVNISPCIVHTPTASAAESGATMMHEETGMEISTKCLLVQLHDKDIRASLTIERIIRWTQRYCINLLVDTDNDVLILVSGAYGTIDFINGAASMQSIWKLKELPIRWDKDETTGLAGRYLLSLKIDVPLWRFHYISDISCFQVIYAGAVLLQMSEQNHAGRTGAVPPLQHTQTPFSWSHRSPDDGGRLGGGSGGNRRQRRRGAAAAEAIRRGMTARPPSSMTRGLLLDVNTIMNERADVAIQRYIASEVRQLSTGSMLQRLSADQRLQYFWVDVHHSKLYYDAQMLQLCEYYRRLRDYMANDDDGGIQMISEPVPPIPLPPVIATAAAGAPIIIPTAAEGVPQPPQPQQMWAAWYPYTWV